MTVRTFFSATALLTATLGVLWLFAPSVMLQGLGAETPDAIAAYMGRRYGAMFFGYSVLLWLARSSGPSPVRTAITVGGAVVTTAIGAVSVFGAVTRVAGPAIWGVAVIEVLLAAGFFVVLARAKD